jgi:hypothetical protein
VACRLVVRDAEVRMLKRETMRRPKRALVVAMAALVMGAACSSGNSGTFKQVQGRVVDQRTGKPVAQARLEATTPQMATVSGSTDAQGRFSLGKVSKQAMLKVTATNYQPANLQLPEGPLEVQLTPVLVSGRVTSGLTQAGLQAGLRALVEQSIAHLANAWALRRWRGLLYRVRDVFRAAGALVCLGRWVHRVPT